MISKRILLPIVLLGCFFESLGKDTSDKTIGEKIGKQVFTFIETLNGVTVEQFCHTTELSRVLLVGEPRFFQTVRHFSIINWLSLFGPLFDNRFKNFINNIEKYSQNQLQEAVKDAILLHTYNTKAYSVSKLLSNLVKFLQRKIVYIKNQNSSALTVYNKFLDKHEKLLVFLQELTVELETNGFITIPLINGRIAKIRDNELIFD